MKIKEVLDLLEKSFAHARRVSESAFSITDLEGRRAYFNGKADAYRDALQFVRKVRYQFEEQENHERMRHGSR